MFRVILLSVVFFGVTVSRHCPCPAEPLMQVNNCVAVVSKEIGRWSEGGFLVLNEKDILLAVTGYRWAPSNSDHHGADIYGFWSRDGGIRWTPQDSAVLLQKAGDLGMSNVMSVSMQKLRSGEVLMSFFAYKQGREHGGTFVKRSTDDGKTWSRAELIAVDVVGMPGRNLQLPTGRIIMPVTVGAPCGSAVMYSYDNGKTWRRSNCVNVKKDGKISGWEPTVAELNNSRLLMFLRTEMGQIYKAYSADGGATWTDTLPTGIPCSSSMNTLTRLQNGELMLIYNMVPDANQIKGPWPRTRLCSMISKDEGQTWGNLRYLDGGGQFEDILKITMASAATVGKDGVVAAWSRSPLHSSPHNNLYDFRLRKFNLQWLYTGKDPTTYQAPE